MPQKPKRVLEDAAIPMIDKAIGERRRRLLFDQAAQHWPLKGKGVTDFGGWTVQEFLDYTERAPGDPLPPRRLGRDTVNRIKALGDQLPVEATLLSRAITDAAPPAGHRVNPTLRDIVDRYLPESLDAFDSSSPRRLKGNAEDLLIGELQLLYQAAGDVLRAEAEHNDRELQIQEAFLKERFSELTPNELDLERRGETPRPERMPNPHRASAGGRVHLRMDHDPTVLLARSPGSERKLVLRLGLPKGHPAVLGCVFEVPSGATGVVHTATRRWFAPKRLTGFRAAQSDLVLRVNAEGTKRFLVYAESTARTAPTNGVLFIRDGAQSQADLETLLTNHAGADITVICSGYATTEGFMIRNEATLYPDLRAACQGFGYSHLSWLDRHTPIV